jgi:hypothetical protein
MNNLAQSAFEGSINNPVLPGLIGDPRTSGGEFFASAIPAAIGLAFVVGALIFFAMLIWGAIQWISSGGDKQALEGARGRVSNALIGIVLLFAAFAIIRVIETFFHISILTLDISSLIIQ